MSDTLEDDYERMLSEARAQAGGDVADYLGLRAANDEIRARSVEWLLGLFSAAAGELNRAGAALQLSRSEAHRFRVGNSTMVGPRLVLSRGIRSLTIEAGWPRAPRDGIIRGGGLACARVSHFGAPSADEELLLLPSVSGGDAVWFIVEKSGPNTALALERVRLHFVKFLA